MNVSYTKLSNRRQLVAFVKELGFTPFSRNAWCFAYEDEEYRANSIVGFATNANIALGEEKFLPKNCRASGGRSTFCFIESTDEVVEEEVITESVVEEVAEDVVEETVIESEESSEEEAASVDWGYAESLYDSDDKSGSKVALENYARQFDIELSRGKTFANMMTDFKAAV